MLLIRLFVYLVYLVYLVYFAYFAYFSYSFIPLFAWWMKFTANHLKLVFISFAHTSYNVTCFLFPYQFNITISWKSDPNWLHFSRGIQVKVTFTLKFSIKNKLPFFTLFHSIFLSVNWNWRKIKLKGVTCKFNTNTFSFVYILCWFIALLIIGLIGI